MESKASLNKVELIGCYGGDLSHACSAWTSTSRELTDEKIQRVEKLLNILATDDHGTPFEKSLLHFLVTTDIATHIHLLKHRIGTSLNAESARYKELKDDKFYIPSDFPDEWKLKLEEATLGRNELYHECLKSLVDDYGFNRKRAKESARFFLGYNNQIISDVTFNFRSFWHFQILRNSEHAQKEVFEVANQMLDIVKALPEFEKTIRVFLNKLESDKESKDLYKQIKRFSEQGAYRRLVVEDNKVVGYLTDDSQFISL